MINREAGLVEIYERIKAKKDDLGLSTFRRSPTSPVEDETYPCIWMIEDVDEMVQVSQRDARGYPARRMLEVVLEIICAKDYPIKQLYVDLRKVVLADPVVADNTFIREIRTEGPNGYGLADVLGMRLVLALTYTDPGI